MHHLIIKYLENSCTKEEFNQILAFFSTEKGQAFLADQLDRDIDQEAYKQIPNPYHTTDFQKIYNNIVLELDSPSPSKVSKVRLLLSAPILKYGVIAASISIILLIGFLWYSPSQYTIYQTNYGEIKTVTLPDQSIATLNANSALTIHKDFLQAREVWVDGEIFFEVQEMLFHDKYDASTTYLPFKVHTDRLEVEVLGTSFNVQDWKERTQIVLNTGKIKLTSENKKSIIMQPGDQVEVSANDPTLKKKVVNPYIYSSWKDQKLICDDTPLSEIALVIEHNFGKKVVFEHPSLRTERITGTIPLADLAIVIEVLVEASQHQIEFQQNQLIIKQ